MDSRAEAIAEGETPECVWLLEHPAALHRRHQRRSKELLDAPRFPVFETGRGGRFTYHGPGQRIAYVMLDLSAARARLRAFVHSLEAMADPDSRRARRGGRAAHGRIGIFVERAKIASIGIRVRQWVSFHGVSLNVDPDFEHFAGIVPCGLKNTPVTSLATLGVERGRR